MCASTDTSNASADGVLVSDEESYDDEYEHDCRAQHFDDDEYEHDDDDSEHDRSSVRSQSCGDHETDHDDMHYDPVDPDNIPIPFDFQHKNVCDGCVHDDERKFVALAGPRTYTSSDSAATVSPKQTSLNSACYARTSAWS